MSTKSICAASSVADLIDKRKATARPSQDTGSLRNQPTKTSDPLNDIIDDLDKMAIFTAPSDSDDDTAQDTSPTSPNGPGHRITVDELTAMFRMTLVHTNMIHKLRAANNSLADQITAIIARQEHLALEMAQVRQDRSGAFAFTPGPHSPRSAAPLRTSSWLGLESGRPGDQWQDMSDIATTLAAAPNGPSPALSRSSSMSNQSYKERRPARPYRYVCSIPVKILFPCQHGNREEHVKRSRITYDRKGGQTPDISPTALSFPASLTTSSVIDSSSDEKEEVNEETVATETAPTETAATENDGTSESSLTSWLFDKASKALFGQ